MLDLELEGFICPTVKMCNNSVNMQKCQLTVLRVIYSNSKKKNSNNSDDGGSNPRMLHADVRKSRTQSSSACTATSRNPCSKLQAYNPKSVDLRIILLRYHANQIICCASKHTDVYIYGHPILDMHQNGELQLTNLRDARTHGVLGVGFIGLLQRTKV